jgi:Bcr/CflA subfamily drug resistance transporter
MLTLVLLAGLAVASLNLFVPSLGNIAADFDVDYALVSLSVAGYLGVTAVLQLVMGPLSDRFGRRPVMLAALGVFVIASLGCMLAPDAVTFLSFRMLQAVIISGWALSMAVIRDTSPEREAASLIGYVAMAMALGPMLAPMLGGVLDELFGWRSSFLVFAGFGAFLFALCWVDLGETNRARSETFSEQFRSYPELFRSGRFWGYALCMMFSTGAFYVFLAGAPLVAEKILSLSPGMLGVAMGTITGGFLLGSYLSGRCARYHAPATMMIAGRLVASAGLLVGLILFLAGVVHPLSLFGATVFAGLGNGLTMPSANAGAMSVRPELAGTASGLAGALTVGGGAALTFIIAAILTEESGAFQLLGTMLLSSLMALAAALYVRAIDRREQRAAAEAAAG